MIDLTPDEIAVLRLIDDDGIEAVLTDAQREIRESLEERGLVYGLGDEYDFDVHITFEARSLIERANPAYWTAELKAKQDALEGMKQRLDNIPKNLERTIQAVREQADRRIKEEEANAVTISEALAERISRAEQELQAWIEENKTRLNLP